MRRALIFSDLSAKQMEIRRLFSGNPDGLARLSITCTEKAPLTAERVSSPGFETESCWWAV